MRAATIVDGHLEWRDHPDPEPGAGELLVAVRAAGVNGPDLVQRRGLYPPPPGVPPDIPGLDVAGEVVATGPGVQQFGPGDRVMAVVAGAGQAELAVVHERVALAVPDGMPWPEAGGFPEVFTTAHDALFTQCGLGPGEHVVVHGAAGGVGIAAVQLAARAGARVTATVRNPELRGRVAELGGPGVEVVDPEGFEDRGPFDVVLELVGAVNFAGDLRSLALGGRISILGVSGGGKAELELFTLMSKRGRIHGSLLRPRPLEEKARAAQLVARHVLPLLRTGAVRVPVERTFPLSEAEAAYEAFAAGGKLGKIVLVSE